MALSTKLLREETKPLTINFPSGTLNIEYRPNSFTPDDIDRLMAAEKAGDTEESGRKVAEEISRMVARWDLVDDSDAPIDPANVDIVAREVPLAVLARIAREIVRDNRLDPNS